MMPNLLRIVAQSIIVFLLSCWITLSAQPANTELKDIHPSSFLKKNPVAYKDNYLALERKLIHEGNKALLVSLYSIHADNLFYAAKYDSAILVLHKALNIREFSNRDELDKIHIQMTNLHYFSANMDSMKYWRTIVEQSNSARSKYGGSLLLVDALAYHNSGEYAKSIQTTLKAIQIFESNKQEEQVALAYQSIAVDFYRIGDLQSQNDYLLKAVEIYNKLGFDYRIIEVYNALGANFNKQNRQEEALTYYNKAYQQLIVSDYPLLLAQNLTNRANIYEKMGQYDKAERLFLDCRDMCEKNDINYGIILSNLNLGNLYRLKKNYTKSEELLQWGLEATRTQKLRREQALAYERLSWLARDRADFQAAFGYQSKYYSLNDSLVNESVKNEANALRSKYDTEKKENEILTLSRSRILMKFVIALLAFLLLALLLVIQSIRTKAKIKEKERQQEEQHLRYDLKMKEKELLAHTIGKVSIMSTKEKLLEELEVIIQDLPKTQVTKFRKLIQELKSEHEQSAIEEFEARFMGVYESFYEKLKDLAPGITPTELRVAALIRLNFSSKEMAMLTNRSVGTIDNIRSSIRKKLQLTDEENLNECLLAV